MVRIVLNHDKTREIILFEYEFKGMCEALRRDLRRENEVADSGNCHEEQSSHRAHVRADKHLLEVLQPKRARPIVRQDPLPEIPTQVSLEAQVELVVEEVYVLEMKHE